MGAGHKHPINPLAKLNRSLIYEACMKAFFNLNLGLAPTAPLQSPCPRPWFWPCRLCPGFWPCRLCPGFWARHSWVQTPFQSWPAPRHARLCGLKIPASARPTKSGRWGWKCHCPRCPAPSRALARTTSLRITKQGRFRMNAPYSRVN